jgi:hypothetical protein
MYLPSYSNLPLGALLTFSVRISPGAIFHRNNNVKSPTNQPFCGLGPLGTAWTFSQFASLLATNLLLLSAQYSSLALPCILQILILHLNL